MFALTQSDEIAVMPTQNAGERLGKVRLPRQQGGGGQIVPILRQCLRRPKGKPCRFQPRPPLRPFGLKAGDRLAVIVQANERGEHLGPEFLQCRRGNESLEQHPRHGGHVEQVGKQGVAMHRPRLLRCALAPKEQALRLLQWASSAVGR